MYLGLCTVDSTILLMEPGLVGPVARWLAWTGWDWMAAGPFRRKETGGQARRPMDPPSIPWDLGRKQ